MTAFHALQDVLLGVRPAILHHIGHRDVDAAGGYTQILLLGGITAYH